MPRPTRRGPAVILVVLMICAALPWAWAQSGGSVIPGVSLAEIRLGAPISEVVQRFGAPSTVRLVGADGTLAYVFGPYGITAYARTNVVVAIATTNSVLGTARGIGMGAPEDAVAAAFGAPRSTGMVEGFPGIAYEALGIAFGFDRHSVAVVMVFAAQAGAAPSTPSPQAAPAATLRVPQDGAGSTANNPRSAASVQAAADATVSAPPVTTAPRQALSSWQPVTGQMAPVPVAPVLAAAGMATPGMAAPVTPLPAAASLTRLPDVSLLRPYTLETRFLSLAGYLRYLVYGLTRQWVGATDVEQVVKPPARTQTP